MSGWFPQRKFERLLKKSVKLFGEKKMAKVYLVIGQDGKLVKPIAVFAKEGEAQISADSHRTEEDDYWVEEINYYG